MVNGKMDPRITDKDMMEKYNKRKKIFKRMLKELGLYNAWVKGRKITFQEGAFYHPMPSDITPQYGFIIHHPDMGSVIHSSFEWVATGNNQLWNHLDGILRCTNFDNVEKVGVENFIKANSLKERCKEIKNLYFMPQ